MAELLAPGGNAEDLTQVVVMNMYPPVAQDPATRPGRVRAPEPGGHGQRPLAPPPRSGALTDSHPEQSDPCDIADRQRLGLRTSRPQSPHNARERTLIVLR
jgi:hypothetical protein